ncbi:integrin-binding sialoprotein L homeolog isoform X1 [Xenopus laevis]|uniref:Integrin-binding sialoprotein n=2 Tax=Xenopus laevis TaxID=8355 RepID=B3SXQ6_XENLA|nr:integrin-binding sialoprotein L homeolog precursor [Xenopus laevis]XP_018105868.1 integrin-binding sialoprotein L homeolog isoform X1 [Xenopus laevis]ABV59379.1 integrin-binding sialoprotein [Xenopus laevis]OCU00021.1 hypothetical protein XELAEV_18005803mg [Xenopus laevis]
MKTALIFLFLLGLSSSFYINRFQRKWKEDEGKGIARNTHGSHFYRSLYMEPRYRQYINYAKGGSSSEENEDSSDESDSDEQGINGKADSDGTGAKLSEGKGAAEEADSENEEEEEEQEAPEVEENSANQNETETENDELDTTTNSTSLETTQASITPPFTRDHEINGDGVTESPGGGVTGPPRVSYDENGGNEEGSNGGISSTAAYETESISVEYEHGYEHTYDHENEVDYRRIRGDNYARYEDEYNYRNRYYDQYAQQYDYYQ